MDKNKTAIVTMLAAAAVLSACSVNVKKEPNGEDKQVDIKTLAGGIHVSNDADVMDTGLSVFPGARMKPKQSGSDNKSANVNISGFGYSLRVVALEYESDAEPAKILDFYKDQLKKYGDVLQCHTSDLDLDMKMESRGSHRDSNKSDSNELTCEGNHGSNIELKVGKKNDQHIVAVKPEGKGSSFSLVYIRTHGKDAEI